MSPANGWKGWGLYKLNGHTPVPCEDGDDWFKSQIQDRHVAMDRLENGTIISTVFLGISYSQPPLLFETMIFGDTASQGKYTRRYATWDEAEAGHKEISKAYEIDTSST